MKNHKRRRFPEALPLPTYPSSCTRVAIFLMAPWKVRATSDMTYMPAAFTAMCSTTTAPHFPHSSDQMCEWVGGHDAVLVGIHLCRRLSSRFIELLNVCNTKPSRWGVIHPVKAFALAPCCLPCANSRAISIQKGAYVRHL